MPDQSPSCLDPVKILVFEFKIHFSGGPYYLPARHSQDPNPLPPPVTKAT